VRLHLTVEPLSTNRADRRRSLCSALDRREKNRASKQEAGRGDQRGHRQSPVEHEQCAAKKMIWNV